MYRRIEVAAFLESRMALNHSGIVAMRAINANLFAAIRVIF